MLPHQQTIPLSSYSDLYDRVIPRDNLLRKINELIDFSFVYKELSGKYCQDNGRMAADPVRMFKYLLLKTIYRISDVDVVERSRFDLSFKYFLGMFPEETVIDPSSLTKFRKLRLKDTDLLDLLINKTVSIAIEKGIIKSHSIIVDSTHTHSRYNPAYPMDILRERAKILRKTIYQTDESMIDKLIGETDNCTLEEELTYCEYLIKFLTEQELLACYPLVKEKMNYLKEAIEDTRDHYILSEDPDARIGHKTTNTSFFGYKTHLAMTEDRIITAAVVTSGEKNDGKQLSDLLKQSINNGIAVDAIIADKAYSCKMNLKLASDNNIRLVSQLHPNLFGTHDKNDGFLFNKDAGMYICPAGHMAIQRAKHGKKIRSSNQYYAYYFDVEKCKVCQLRNGCYKEGAKTKSYNVSIKTPEQEDQMRFHESEYFMRKAKERYKIEAKNAELKNRYGYNKADAAGIGSMQMQGAMAIFAANVKRILKLMD